ncbi:hypothetical protein MPSEU_000593300 [Mayamaea pseudoterrestris]|nr:hypothetical protein MPSEU_000593300 [Mayamaea pseudoterrestris]
MNSRSRIRRCARSLSLCLLLALLHEAHSFRVETLPTLRHQSTFRLYSQPSYRRPPSQSSFNDRRNQPNQRRPRIPNKSASTWSGNVDQIRFNKEIVSCTEASQVLQLLQTKPLGNVACGGALSSVNFSTAIHRLAKHSVTPPQHYNAPMERVNARANILTDPRFALFLASIAEALASEAGSDTLNINNDSQSIKPNFQFDSRELANIGWALAKLKIAPPQSVLAVDLEATSNQDALVASAKEVRKHVLDAAKQRQATGSVSSHGAWIPALSRVAGLLLDYIGIFLLEMASTDSNRNRRPFQMQEYANLLWSFATAGRASSQVCCVVLQAMMQRQRNELLQLNEDNNATVDLLKPQEWSNSIWSMATAQLEEASETVGDVLEFVSVLLVEYPDFKRRFKPQEWSNTVWGVAALLSGQHKLRDTGLTSQEETAASDILRVTAQTLLEDGRIVASMKSQELANTIWGFSTLGFGLPTSSVQNNVNNYLVISSQSPNDDAKLTSEFVDLIASSALPILHKFRSQELNNMAWSLARLVEDTSARSIPELLERICREFNNPRRTVATQDIGTTLWSLATMKYFDPKLYRGILARLTPQMISDAKPQELSNILWAVATAEMPVEDIDAFDTSLVVKRPKITDQVTYVFGLAGKELMRRPDQFKPQEIKDVLWSFSRVGIRFPALFKATTEYLVGGVEASSKYPKGRGINDFSTQGLANLVWAFARQAQLAEDVSTRQPASRLASGNGRLVVYTTSYLDIGEKLMQKLFKTVADATLTNFDDLRKLKPQDLCLIAWAFAVLGLKHTRFIESARDEVQRRLQENVNGRANVMNTFKGQELANFFWSMGSVDAEPGALLETLTEYLSVALGDTGHKQLSQGIARIFLRQELANIAWSCAVFWAFPEPLMRRLYAGLVGLDDSQDPAMLTKAHGDSGLQPQAIMTLVYVQTAMCLVGGNGGLSLPLNFPNGWQEPSLSKSFDHTTDTILELKLSTSKIQRDVSEGLHRVGFQHVDEFIITMHTLREEYRVNVPDSPYEVLSIDMANVEKKIAIEVDGPAHYINEIEFDSDVEAGFSKPINGKFEYQFRWRGDRQKMNGSSVLKEHLLELLGWKVIHIPFWEWYQLESNEAAENDYCRKILAGIE